jgi:anti-anti-sigma regulatory factor
MQELKVQFPENYNEFFNFENNIKILKNCNKNRVILDFSNTDIISSSIIFEIFKLYKLLSKNESILEIDNVNNTIYKILKITNLDKIVKINKKNN